MKKLMIAALTLAALAGCTQKTGNANGVAGAVKVQPMLSNLDINALTDCTVPATFAVENFDWSARTLTMEIYSEDLYDAVEVSQLKMGDTLVYDGQPKVVDTLYEENGFINVNGEIDEGGACLISAGGGTYRASGMDDYSNYTLEGKVTLPLADDFIIIACKDLPDEPSDTIRSNQEQYLESLSEFRRGFYCTDTQVRIAGGKVVSAQRFWVP